MSILYIIAGPNGAGKTTASYEVLPGLWDCKEFVNADEIARGLSPFNPEEMAFAAGRIQLERIEQLLSSGETFSLETTLATRSYVRLVERAQTLGYEVELLFLFLPSPEDAIERVRLRVLAGGHNIPTDVIRRRYHNGLKNFFTLYAPIVDRWKFVDNKPNPSEFIATMDSNLTILKPDLFYSLIESYGK